jgi:hypothetical protein
MKNVNNALTDVASMYMNNCIEYDILSHNEQDGSWIVNVYNRDTCGSLLQIEVIDDDGIPKCCVLQNINVGRRSMVRFMNRLVDVLDS